MPLLDRPKNWPAHLPWATRSPEGNVILTPMGRGEIFVNRYMVKTLALCAENRRGEALGELETLHLHLCELQDALAQRLTVENGYKDLADARKQTLEALQGELEMARGTIRVLSRMIEEALDATAPGHAGQPDQLSGAAGETLAPADATPAGERLTAPIPKLALAVIEAAKNVCEHSDCQRNNEDCANEAMDALAETLAALEAAHV